MSKLAAYPFALLKPKTYFLVPWAETDQLHLHAKRFRKRHLFDITIKPMYDAKPVVWKVRRAS